MQNYTQQPSVSRVIPPSRKINKCVGIEEFLQRSKQPNFSMRVAQLGKGDTVTPDKEDSKVTEGALGHQVDKAHINVKQNRKLNMRSFKSGCLSSNRASETESFYCDCSD